MSVWKDKKTRALSHMGGCCQDCKGIFPEKVYDFHHLKDKDADWGQMRTWSWSKILNELTKCVMLCANCHRIRHS